MISAKEPSSNRLGNTDSGMSDEFRIAAGHTSTSSGFFNFALVRYNVDGSLDTSFGSTGTVLTTFGQFDDVRALARASAPGTPGPAAARGSHVSRLRTVTSYGRRAGSHSNRNSRTASCGKNRLRCGRA